MKRPKPKPTPKTAEEAVDLDALQLALDLTLADDPPDPGRIEQVTDFLRERDWLNVAEFCSYHQQMERLKPHPAQSPPCWILTAAQADAILAKVAPACDGSGFDISNCRYARLTKRMLKLNISPYHPNPLQAIKEAQRAKKVLKLRP